MWVVQKRTRQLVSCLLVVLLPLSALGEPDQGQSSEECPIDFILKTCSPFKTFQSCKNRTCVCPNNLRPVLLKNNLTIDTYWNSQHRQCVSKVNSVCFYLPPSFLVSQPYRCVAKHASCVQAPGQFKGVGICKCDENFVPSPSGHGCVPTSQAAVNFASASAEAESGGAYNVEDQCNWKFQCPHLQECVNGRCKCPTGQRSIKNAYEINMVWNKEDNVCESAKGSYCNNARFHNADENVVVKSILRSLMEVRCAPGLRCEESTGFEIGICNAAGFLPSLGLFWFGVSWVMLIFV